MKDALQSFLIALVTSVAVLFGLGPVMLQLSQPDPPAVATVPAAPAKGPQAAPDTGSRKAVEASADATTPNVEGMLVRDARQRWRDQGILIIEDRTRVDSAARAGTILEQTPRAGVVLEQKEIRVIVAVPAELSDVPNVVGRDLAQARSQLEELGFELSEPTTTPSEEKPGVVLSQQPEPGTKSEKGAVVRLTVAARLVEVPLLKNQKLPRARRALEKQGLALGKVVEREDEELSGGRVLSQSPPAGSSVEAGTTVDLVVVAPD